MVNIPGARARPHQRGLRHGGPQLLIDTLDANFGIKINHYVEVDFKSFQAVVDTIGNVKVYLPGRVRDEETGLDTPFGAGCYPLDGRPRLAYVRSRTMQIFDPNGPIVDENGDHWRLLDVRADLDRIPRQQAFIRKLAGLAISKSLGDPFLAVDLADNVLKYVTVDQNLGRDEVNELIRAFRTVNVNDPNSHRDRHAAGRARPAQPERHPRARRRTPTRWSPGSTPSATTRPRRSRPAVAGEGRGGRRHRHGRGPSAWSTAEEQGFQVTAGSPRATKSPSPRSGTRPSQAEAAEALLAYFPDAKFVPDPTATKAGQARARVVVPRPEVPSTTTTVPAGARRAGHHRPAHDDDDPGALGDRPLPLTGAGSRERPVHFPAVRILVTGAGGQVGARVVDALAAHDVLGVAHDELDLADREQVEQVVADFGPDAVVNAAAMTNVDGCERDPERAFAVNALGVRTLAQATARASARTWCTSRPTTSSTAPPPGPTTSGTRCTRSRSTGGRSSAARSSWWRTRASWAIVRTSWVFGRRGTDLVSWAFGAFDRGELDGVLADQVSIPTYAPDLAELLARFAVAAASGSVPRHQRDRGGHPPRADRDRAARPRGRPESGSRRSTPPTSTGPRPGRR